MFASILGKHYSAVFSLFVSKTIITTDCSYLQWEIETREEKEKPKDRQVAAAIAVDEHETDQPVTMAVL